MFEPNDDTQTVAGDTDDLAAFETLMFGKAKTPSEEPKDSGNNSDPVKDIVDAKAEENNEPVNLDEDDDEPELDIKPKKTNKVQERINQVLERERLARERAEALELKVAELERTRQTDTTKTPVQTVDTGPSPDAKNEDGSDKYPLGEFDPTYIRDLTRHTIQQEQEVARSQNEHRQAQLNEQQARQELDTQWRARLETVTQVHDDFLDKTVELESAFDGLDSKYSDYLVQTIKSLDHGPEVLYYFANNLPEAQKFVKMGPLAATLALGEYNAMFKGQSRKEAAKVSSAPPPPQVNKGSNTRKSVAADTDDLDAFSQMFYSKKR
jgi:hypothetical protein